MVPTQEMIVTLARRLEEAYLRRHPDWTDTRSSSGVWNTAAGALIMLHHNSPAIPIDPELFVAVQPKQGWGDPWIDLAGESATRRYRRHVRRIVSILRLEIGREVRLVERRTRRGDCLITVLSSFEGKLSPLSRYVLARRAGQNDLAERLRPDAESQHRSCPLYQQACRRLLPGGTYPLPRQTGLLPGLIIPAGLELPSFSMN